MGQVLHGCATATETVRRAIQHSQESLRILAERYGINPKTVVNQTARELGVGGRGLLGANIVLGLADTATSNNPARTRLANVGASGGGLLGGALGAPAGPLGRIRWL
jgi:hypothetical protein